MDLTNIMNDQGISALMSVLKHFTKLSNYLGLIPIYPNLILSKHHNNGKETLLSDYIIIPESILLTTPIDATCDNTLVWVVKNNWPLFDLFYKQYADKITKVPHIPVPYKSTFDEIGKRITDTFARPLCCVHVRRTDYLSRRSSLDNDTQPQHIQKTIEALNKEIKSLYIMTDEPDPNYFNILKSSYNLIQFSDIPELVQIKTKDNYELYLVEDCIRKYSDIRISTFKTNNSFYQAYLSEYTGAQ